MIYDEKWALNEAVKYADISKCKSKRGVIIWNRFTGMVGAGWNRPPFPFKCDGSEECRCDCAKTAVHAEQVALLDMISSNRSSHPYECEMLHVKSVDGIPVFSDKPSCWQCSKLILEAKIPVMWLYLKDGLKSYTSEEFHQITLYNNNLYTNKY
jgi:deoxycytidylate deaminase